MVMDGQWWSMKTSGDQGQFGRGRSVVVTRLEL